MRDSISRENKKSERKRQRSSKNSKRNKESNGDVVATTYHNDK